MSTQFIFKTRNFIPCKTQELYCYHKISTERDYYDKISHIVEITGNVRMSSSRLLLARTRIIFLRGNFTLVNFKNRLSQTKSDLFVDKCDIVFSTLFALYTIILPFAPSILGHHPSSMQPVKRSDKVSQLSDSYGVWKPFLPPLPQFSQPLLPPKRARGENSSRRLRG